jgi:hypothetical protein
MSVRNPIAAARRRLAQEAGFSLIAVMLMMFAATAVFAAAYATANGDIPLTGGDSDRKQSYSAAEGGINYYLYHLTQDNSYWTYCANVPAPGPGQPNPVNEVWNGQGSDPRVWRTVPGTKSKYTIELLPANGSGFSTCNQQNSASMIDQTNGTFRIRATGKLNAQKRSIIATFRRKTFLDYLYFTDFETQDPVVYQSSSPAQQALLAAQCSQYRRAGRPEPPCVGITFASADQILGPFHTNDDILVCGSPVFGRSVADKIEVSGPAPGFQASGSCSASPNFVGTYKAASPVLAMPQSNNALKSVATSQYTFTGTTTIQLQGATMLVTNAARGLNRSSMPLPANGVVYVQNGICGVSYTLTQNYNDPPGCADLFVQGSYSQSLTLASENDVIVNGNITRNGNVTLGLIPNNFARIYHPVTNRNGNSCTNAAGSMNGVHIDAAILSLAHSFIVDNYYCGAALGTLTVNGAIAQRFRGPVGTGGSTISTGYLKAYSYDDRLKYQNPPHFLSPIQAPWDLMRFTEQAPPV